MRLPAPTAWSRLNLLLRAVFTVLFGLWTGAAAWADTTNVTRLTLSPVEGGALRVNWPVRSVVPAPGRAVFARYQLERSADLAVWEPAGRPQAGAGHAALEALLDPPAGPVFFRLRTTVELSRTNLRAAVLNDADFRDALLDGSDLTRAQLQRADLRGADLGGASAALADFSEADLRGANLAGGDFREARFSDAQLDGAVLFAARLEHADLTSAKLLGADLRFAGLSSAVLFSANLFGADLRGCSLAEADLRLAALHGTRLDALTTLPPKSRRIWQIVNEGRPGGVFTNLDLGFANLTGLDLTDGDFRQADLSVAALENSDLCGADFTGADLSFVFWAGSQIDERTRLTPKARLNWQLVNEGGAEAQLDQKDLSMLILSRTDLRGASLRRANLTGSTLNEVNFRGADLTGANLSRTDLTRTDFTGAKLDNVNFAGATFSRTVMSDGSLRGP